MSEAFAVGTPVLSTEVGGASDVIESGVSGFLVSCGRHRRTRTGPETNARAARGLEGGERTSESNAVGFSRQPVDESPPRNPVFSGFCGWHERCLNPR
ncbi:MAG: glycosyltransferase [Vicinamibacteria bacterium]